MPTASLRFGEGDAHELRMELSLLGGERYYVGDALVYRHWSLRLSDSREFVAKGHVIRICFQLARGGIASQVYVDGLLQAEDLFVVLNRRVQKKRWSVWTSVAVWVGIALASFVVTRWVSN